MENFEHVCIVGLGLIGGSIAKDVRTYFPEAMITAFDPSAEALDKAIEDKVIDASTTVEELGRTACFVVIASPIESIIPVAKAITDAAQHNTRKMYAIDVSSVKTDVVDAFQGLSNEHVEFLGTHPMAGTEFAGYAHARKDLFRAKPWMICANEQNTEQGIAVVKQFIGALGGRIREMDASDHDRHVAVVSHSIILLSNYIFDYIATQHPESLEFAGDGFTSTTRLASGNPSLHTQIMKSNNGPTRAEVEAFHQYLGAALEGELVPTKDFFAKNVERRNRWLHKRK